MRFNLLVSQSLGFKSSNDFSISFSLSSLRFHFSDFLLCLFVQFFVLALLFKSFLSILFLFSFSISSEPVCNYFIQLCLSKSDDIFFLVRRFFLSLSLFYFVSLFGFFSLFDFFLIRVYVTLGKVL